MFEEFIDSLPDYLCEFLISREINSFTKLLEFSEIKLMRQGLRRKDIKALSASLSLYRLSLPLDD